LCAGRRQQRNQVTGFGTACVEPVAGIRPIWDWLFALVIGTIIVAAMPWISIGFLD
jgi:hypothetical protein